MSTDIGTTQGSATDQAILNEARESLWPVRPSARSWGFWGAASVASTAAIAGWVFSIGVTMAWWLPLVPGLLVLFGGLTLGSGFLAVGVGSASTKYGLTTAQVATPQFGRTVQWPISLFAWFITVLALGNIMVVQGQTTSMVLVKAGWIGEGSQYAVSVVLALVCLAVGAALAMGGARRVRNASVWFVIGLAVTLGIIFVVTLVKYGGTLANAKPAYASGDGALDAWLGIEFALAGTVCFYGWYGALSRWTTSAVNGTVGLVFGLGVLQAAATVGAYFAALATGDPSPAGALANVAGLWVAWLTVLMLLIANIGTAVVCIYAAGVEVKTVPSNFIRYRLPWRQLAVIITVPAVFLVFFGDWYMSNIALFFFISGLVPPSWIAVNIVDYYLFRRQKYSVSGCFDRSNNGPYAYWRGFNPVAWVCVGLGVATYLLILNPYDYTYGPLGEGIFKYVGATIPAIVVAGGSFAILTPLVTWRLQKGGYERYGTAKSGLRQEAWEGLAGASAESSE